MAYLSIPIYNYDSNSLRLQTSTGWSWRLICLYYVATEWKKVDEKKNHWIF